MLKKETVEGWITYQQVADKLSERQHLVLSFIEHGLSVSEMVRNIYGTYTLRTGANLQKTLVSLANRNLAVLDHYHGKWMLRTPKYEKENPW